MDNFVVVVIGAGPGGYVAAIRAAQNGLKTCVVERDPQLGGTCLLRGCIPTKSLLHSADVLQKARESLASGIITGSIDFDYTAMQRERAKQVQKGAQGVAYLMKKNGVEVVPGHGKIVGPNAVEVRGKTGTRKLQAKHVIIATGSKPRDLPHLPHDGKVVVTSNELLEAKEVPKRMVVLGAGAVGVEFASVFSRLGTKVTVVEVQDRLVPNEDTEVSAEFLRILRKRGLDCRVNTKCTSVHVAKGVAKVELAPSAPDAKEAPTQLEVDVVLVAAGRAPVTDGLGLAEVGISLDARGYIATDARLHTGVGSIYAIGDVINTPWLAHVASSEALYVADQLAGKPAHPINYSLVPGCTYSSPEIGSVGLSEVAAKAQGRSVKVGKFPFAAIAKARVLGDTEGFVKIVCDARYGEILGVHIIGPHATDLIAEACVAIRLESTAEDLAHTIHAHPTLAESVMEAAHAATGLALHL